MLDHTECDEVVTTKYSEAIDAFSSRIINAQMETTFTGGRLNTMTHALCAEEGSLSQGLTVQNAYTEMHNGSKNVTVLVRNSMVYPQTPKRKILVAKVVAANQVPELQMQPGMIDMLDEAQGIQTEKLNAEQRQEMLFEKSELSALESWPPELAWSNQLLLAEYHNIFSLESCDLSCTHLTKHVIKSHQ